MIHFVSSRNNGLADFRRELERVFDDFWTMPAMSQAIETSPAWAPAADIDEESDHYMLSLEVPGLKKDELKIEMLGDHIVISGERKHEERKEKKGALYSERRFGRFQRTFAIPSHVDGSKIEAQYQDGVLKVYVPKAEAAKPRQIKIGESSTGGFFNRLLGKKEEGQTTIDHKTGERVAS
jgi:HSP20 family protein